MNAVMPTMLAWVLGGNTSALRNTDRYPHCRLADKPKTFDEKVRLLCLHCVDTVSQIHTVLSACINTRISQVQAAGCLAQLSAASAMICRYAVCRRQHAVS